MANTRPFYSAKPFLYPKRYHNDTRCTEGNNIEPRYLRFGMGVGRTLCAQCQRLMYRP